MRHGAISAAKSFANALVAQSGMQATLLARHAGITVAANATTASNPGTVRKVAKSLALTPNNRLAITRVTAAAHTKPAKIPISASCIPCQMQASEFT